MQNLTAAAANYLIDAATIEASGPTKRLKVSDINISRYEEEFLKIREIASGTFGTVSVARHRLDGMVYAIKVSYLTINIPIGQLISKGRLGFFFNSPKKRTKKFCPSRLGQKFEFSSSFFWENWRHQNDISKLTDL